jgi:hypothetical protein
MILPEKLLQEALNEFEEKKKRSFVIRESLPILFFGDLPAFSKQQKKIINVGLNPSNIEFQHNASAPYFF